MYSCPSWSASTTKSSPCTVVWYPTHRVWRHLSRPVPVGSVSFSDGWNRLPATCHSHLESRTWYSWILRSILPVRLQVVMWRIFLSEPLCRHELLKYSSVPTSDLFLSCSSSLLPVLSIGSWPLLTEACCWTTYVQAMFHVVSSLHGQRSSICSLGVLCHPCFCLSISVLWVPFLFFANILRLFSFCTPLHGVTIAVLLALLLRLLVCPTVLQWCRRRTSDLHGLPSCGSFFPGTKSSSYSSRFMSSSGLGPVFTECTSWYSLSAFICLLGALSTARNRAGGYIRAVFARPFTRWMWRCQSYFPPGRSCVHTPRNVSAGGFPDVFFSRSISSYHLPPTHWSFYDLYIRHLIDFLDALFFPRICWLRMFM